MFEEIHKFHGHAHSRLPYPCSDSCCLALVSKVRFIGDGAQRFLLKWAECMKEFSVDIILRLSGDPLHTSSQGRFRLASSWWEVEAIKATGWMKALSSESLNSIGWFGSPSWTQTGSPPPLPMASNLHLYFHQFASSCSPFLMQTLERKLNPCWGKGGANTFHEA